MRRRAWTWKNRWAGHLTRLGGRLGARFTKPASQAAKYLETGRRLAERRLAPATLCNDRDDVFSTLARRIQGDRVLYLEFGVGPGHSLARWTQLLRGPGVAFHGFDSFLGLPEAWRELEAGHFGREGVSPPNRDPRVHFHVGWFDATLPEFTPPDHDRLIANVDCDLYSSTRTVLAHLRKWLRPGDYVYFDEFAEPEHELKAFLEFLDTGVLVRLVLADRPHQHVVFQVVNV